MGKQRSPIQVAAVSMWSKEAATWRRAITMGDVPGQAAQRLVDPPSRLAEPAGTYLTERMQRSLLKAVRARCVSELRPDAVPLARSLQP